MSTVQHPTFIACTGNPSGGGASVTGSVRSIRIPVALGSVSSAATIPAGAYGIEVTIDVTTGYSPGITVEVGRAGVPALLVAAGDFNPKKVGLNVMDALELWGVAAVVLVTIGGGPAVGVAVVLIRYTEPDV